MSEQSGLGQESGNRTFLSLKGRHFILKAEHPQTEEEAKALIAEGWKANHWTIKGAGEGGADKTGVTYEKRFPSLIGQLKETFEHDGKYAVEQKFVVYTENGESFQFSADKYMNSQVENLMNRMCNDDFDPSKPVKLVPYKKPKEGKTGYNEGVMIFHLDEKGRYAELVKKEFTVENPGDYPKWEKKKVSGKDKWNNDATMEFLTKQLEAKMKDVPEAEFPQVEVAEEDSKDEAPF